MDHWRKLERQFVSRAFRLALPNAGKSSPAKMAMTAMTTRSSMSVKAHLLTGREPLAIGEIPFIGFAFALVRISETASPRPVGCQAKMAVSEDKPRMTGGRADGHLPIKERGKPPAHLGPAQQVSACVLASPLLRTPSLDDRTSVRLPIRWLAFGRVGLIGSRRRTHWVTMTSFKGCHPYSNVPGFSRHEQRMVRRTATFVRTRVHRQSSAKNQKPRLRERPIPAVL